MRILVVDDDPDILTLLERVLTKLDHIVVTASRGGDAIFASLRDDVDLLMCDLMLPDLQGTEVIRAIKAQAPHLPVMVISAMPAEQWRRPCLDAGATGYLEKPLHLDALRRELALVERSRPHLHVLVADPDTVHRRRLEMELRGLGCRVEVCEFLPRDLDSLTRDLEPELLLVDDRDPGAVQVCTWGRERRLPVAVMGQHFSPGDEERLLRAGAALILDKPVNVEALITQARFLSSAP